MSCYLPTSSIRSSPRSSQGISQGISQDLGGHSLGSPDPFGASRKRRLLFSTACHYSHDFKKPRVVDSSATQQHPANSATASSPSAAIGNTPPASPVHHASASQHQQHGDHRQQSLSNKSSASSLGSTASSLGSASSSVITDCSLRYLDTLPTSIHKLCNTNHDPWDLSDASDCDCHEPYQEHSEQADGHSVSKASPAELQEIESFYLNWRKNFEKWLLTKNPKKYNEFKSFLKFNTASRLSEHQKEQHALQQCSSHGQAYPKVSSLPSSSSTARASDSSIRHKINQYLVKKPVFNAKISRKFKNKSTDIILNSLTKKRHDAEGSAAAATSSSGKSYILPDILRSSCAVSYRTTTDAAASASASSVRLSPILTIPKNSHSKPVGTSSIRLPSINEILDSEPFSVAKAGPSPTKSISSAVVAGNRRSISSSSVDSANSVFSDLGAGLSSSSAILADDGLSYTNNTTKQHCGLSPPLIAFKSQDSYSHPYSHIHSHPHTHVSNYQKLPDSMTPKLPSSVSPYQYTSPKRTPSKPSPKKSSSSSASGATCSAGASSKSSHHAKRTCLSCGSSQSPCWRPSWSLAEGQLCNSCGLRYKKTNARCLNDKCLRIPAKGEFNLIKSKAGGNVKDYKCLRCGSCVEVK